MQEDHEEAEESKKQIYFKQFHGIPIFIMHSFLKTVLCRYRRLYNLLTQMGPFLLVLLMQKNPSAYDSFKVLKTELLIMALQSFTLQIYTVELQQGMR